MQIIFIHGEVSLLLQRYFNIEEEALPLQL